MALQYVKIHLTLSLSFITCLRNKYSKLVNVIVSCFQVYGKESREL